MRLPAGVSAGYWNVVKCWGDLTPGSTTSCHLTAAAWSDLGLCESHRVEITGIPLMDAITKALG